ncbi:hypothetical protein LTR96_011829 [Exophiala xenobiotica]|nr:hypothetical protein LTR96_011829 [Exophiala xenobiotica]
MWREVVENQKQGGVILALRPWVPGRLCKVISLLATISECSRSPDQNIRDQIPPHLRQSKALILTPASLGDNWRQEFVKWARNCTSLGDFYHIASSDTEPIEQWHRRGGILLLSYDRFTNYLSSPTRHEADTDVPTDYDDDMGKILLEGPNIVIADEAHQMKNSNSKLASWVDPGCLGALHQFRARYIKPIAEGLRTESTQAQKTESVRKLKYLEDILRLKMVRADSQAITKGLPPKTDFVVTTPPTDLQKRLYNVYVEAMLASGDRRTNSPPLTTWWARRAILALINQHPSTLRTKIEECHRMKRTRDAASDGNRTDINLGGDIISDLEILPHNVQVDETGQLGLAAHQAMEIFREVDNVDDAVHSPKDSCFAHYSSAASHRNPQRVLWM